MKNFNDEIEIGESTVKLIYYISLIKQLHHCNIVIIYIILLAFS